MPAETPVEYKRVNDRTFQTMQSNNDRLPVKAQLAHQRRHVKEKECVDATWVKADDGGARPFKQHSVSYLRTKIAAAAAVTTTTTTTTTTTNNNNNNNNDNNNDTFRYM